MPLIADYAITPDVFDATSYSNAGECEARLETIREAMLEEGMVRDLRDGSWQGLFTPTATPKRRWHPRGMELVKELRKQERLVRHAPALPEAPAEDSGWCAEALAAHDAVPMSGGVIVTERIKDEYLNERLVARVDQLRQADWWKNRSSSVRLTRTLADYEKHLELVLRCSKSLMFIDAHLDPAKPGYSEFGTLLQRAGRRSPPPLIEIHRVCYEGSGRGRRLPMRTDDPEYFERRFRNALGRPLRDAGLTAEVFIWDDCHDRYLISDVIGIQLPNGFDTSRAADARATAGCFMGIPRYSERVRRHHSLAQSRRREGGKETARRPTPRES